MPNKNTGIGFINNREDFDNLAKALLNQLNALSIDSAGNYTSFTDTKKSTFIAYIDAITGRGRQDFTIKDAYQVLFIIFYRYVVNVYQSDAGVPIGTQKAVAKTNTLVAKLATAGQYGNTGVVRRQTTEAKIKQLERVVRGPVDAFNYYGFSGSATVIRNISDSSFRNLDSFGAFAAALIRDKLRISSPSRRTSTTRRTSTPSTSTSTTPSTTTSSQSSGLRLSRAQLVESLNLQTICANPITPKQGTHPWAEKDPYERAKRLGGLFLYICNVFYTYDNINDAATNQVRVRKFSNELVSNIVKFARMRGFSTSEGEKFAISMMMLLSTGRINMAKKICKPFMQGKRVRDTNAAHEFVIGNLGGIESGRIFTAFREGMFKPITAIVYNTNAYDLYGKLVTSVENSETVKTTINKIKSLVPIEPLIKPSVLTRYRGTASVETQLVSLIRDTFTDSETPRQHNFFTPSTTRTSTQVTESSRTSQTTPATAPSTETLIRDSKVTDKFDFGVEFEHFGLSLKTIKEVLGRLRLKVYPNYVPYHSFSSEQQEGLFPNGEINKGWFILQVDGSVDKDRREPASEFPNRKAEAIVTQNGRRYDTYYGELVSPVLGGKKGLQIIYRALNALVRKGMRHNSTTGMHVHITKKGFNSTNIRNLMYNYMGMERIIQNFFPPSRRYIPNQNTRGGYNGKFFLRSRYYGFDSSEEEVKSALKRDVLDISDTAFYEKHKSSKTQPVNLVPYFAKHTIEFRDFGGSFEGDEVVNWLLFLFYFTEFSKKYRFKKFTWDSLIKIMPTGLATFWYNRIQDLTGKSPYQLSWGNR